MAYSISLNQKCCLAGNFKLLVTLNVGNCIKQGSSYSYPFITLDTSFFKKTRRRSAVTRIWSKIYHWPLLSFLYLYPFFWTNRTFIQHLLNIKSLELQVYKHEEGIELSPKQGQISVTHAARGHCRLNGVMEPPIQKKRKQTIPPSKACTNYLSRTIIAAWLWPCSWGEEKRKT